MRPLKMEILILIILITQLTLVKNATNCIQCNSCNESEKVCNICNSGYKSTYAFPSTCITCSSSPSKPFFYFTYEPVVCHPIESCPNGDYKYWITDTNECVKQCPPGYFRFNNYCFKGDCPQNTVKDDSNTNECKCKYFYTVTTSTPYIYTCYSKDDICPDNYYYDLKDMKCLSAAPTSPAPTHIRKIIKRGITNIQIIEKCNDDEFFINNNPIECVKDCTKQTGNEYHNFKSKQCQSINAFSKNDQYLYEENKTFYDKASDCPTNYNILFTSDYYQCVNYTSCLETTDRPFLYELTKTCLENCNNAISANTDVPVYPTTKMYELIEPSRTDTSQIIKKCVKACPESKPYIGKYKKGTKDYYRCVTKCGEEGTGIYTYNRQCYAKCSEAISTTDYDYYTIDTYICTGIKGCPPGYYKNKDDSDKKCYKNCTYVPTNNYLDKSKTMCIKIPSTDCPYIVEGDKDHLCYDNACPSSAPYYNDDSSSTKKCFSSEIGCNDPKNDIKYIYHDPNNPFRCLPCSSSNYIREDYACLSSSGCTDAYPYRYNKICYKNGCPYPTQIVDSSDPANIKCDLLKNCAKYIQNGECVTKCDKINYPYEIAPTTTTNGLCFKTIEECYNLKYIYTNSARICTQSCSVSSTTYAIQLEPGTFHPYKRDLGTCIGSDTTTSSCPLDFPYESSYYCYKESCPSGTYITSVTNGIYTCSSCSNSIYQNRECTTSCQITPDIFDFDKKCVNKCPENKPYYYSSNYVCLDKCNDYNYYDPDTKQCFDKCKDMPSQAKTFGIYNLKNPSPCLESCPVGYYYHKNNNLCITSCADYGYYYTFKDRKVCDDNCETGEKIGYQNECVKECPAYFYNYNGKYYCKSRCFFVGLDKKQYSIVVNSTNECLVDTCPNDEKYLYDKICTKKCPPDKPYYFKDEHGNNVCYSLCSNYGDNIYHNENSYKCYLSTVGCFGDDAGNYNYRLENSFECLSKCPDDFPAENKIRENQNTPKTEEVKCTKTCESPYVFEDNICVSQCNLKDKMYKPYLDTSIQTCVSKCPNRLPYFTQKIVSGKPSYYECISSCQSDVNILPTNECAQNNTYCPPNYNFIGKGNICKSKCDPEIDGTYYYNIVANPSPTDLVYKCIDSCANAPDNKFNRAENDLECLLKCPTNHKYKSPLNICYSICKDNKEYPFSIDDGTNPPTCALECPSTSPALPVYLEDKVCISETDCTDYTKYNRVINEHKQCVVQCDRNSNFRFNLTRKCTTSCDDTYKYYSTKDYICVKKCLGPDNYIRDGKICESSCDSNSVYKYAYKNADVYECRDICPSGTFYYEGVNECLTACTTGHYIIDGTQICVSSCKDITDYYAFDGGAGETFTVNTCVKNCFGTTKPYRLESGKCSVTSCKTASNTNKYYIARDNICLTECPQNYVYDPNTNECKINCKANEYLLPSGKCDTKCDSTSLYIYYVPGDNACLKKCPDNYYIYADTVNTGLYKCLTSCTQNDQTKKYSDNGVCVANCPTARQYFVKEFTHGEINIQKICLTDCPKEYPYLIIDTTSTPNLYQCVGNCPNYYITEIDPNKNSKTCKDNCESTTPYIGDDHNCLEKCPDNMPYYIPATGTAKNIQCMPKCNTTALYHEENSYKCINACSNTNYYINYTDNTCIIRCELNQFWGEKDGKKYCLNECNEKFGLYWYPDRKCTIDCSDSNNIYTADFNTKKCNCSNLYKINEEYGYEICYPYATQSCSKNTDDYIYLKENTKQCLKTCPTIVSPLDVCLNSTVCPNNTIATRLSNGITKCVCENRFIIDDLNKLVCLGKNEDCLSDYKYYIIETKQCVKECPTTGQKYIFNNYCLSACPENSLDANPSDNKCKCKTNWYIEPSKTGKETENEFICIKEDNVCTKAFPFLNPDTKQCLSKCKGSNFIYYNEQCLQTCKGITNSETIVPIKANSTFSNYGNYTCRCSNVWYYQKDNKNIVCQTSSSTKCKDIANLVYIFEIKDTKECVPSCSGDYPYTFNYECFKNCESNTLANNYNLKIDENNNKNCKCVYPWKKDTSTNEIKCELKNYCTGDGDNTVTFSNEYLLINSTGECVKKTICPDDHPLLFNGICYDDANSCPNKTHYDSRYAKQCICDNLWYYISVSYKGSIQDQFCIEKSIEECPPDYPIQINNTKQCLSKDKSCKNTVDTIYKFNFKCYDKCPLNTKKETNPDSNGDTFCTCDKVEGYWYEYIIDDKKYYKCGLKSCPQEKPFAIIGNSGTFECIHSCVDKNPDSSSIYYRYLNYCYIGSECPINSAANDNKKECVHRSLDEATHLAQLYKFVQEDILYLYQTNVTLSGFLYQKFNTSLQIYGLNKDGSKGTENHIQKNNLSYIDLNNCIKKIYEDNDMLDTDDIIVVKYDILNISTINKYIMNPVEYEFYSSRTGEKIDATVCESYSILLSYPISYVSKKFDDFTNGKYNNSFLELFQRGKILNQEDSDIDTFDSNNSFYYDLCISCEIKGKDLVLQDRISYLYPNISLCEKNCSYLRTDFTKERVYCKCSLKKEFDFNRDYSISNYNFSIKEIDSLQKGPSNVPTMKCMSKFKKSETTIKNGAFYYSALILIGQIILCIVGTTIGIKSLNTILNFCFGQKALNEIDFKRKKHLYEELNIQDPQNPSLSSPPPRIKNDEKTNPSLNSEQNRLDSDYYDGGVEFIPEEYVFLFFSNQDKGIVRKYLKSRIPFKINPNTKFLLQKIPNTHYNKGLVGPYELNQNIVEIIDDKKEKESKERKALDKEIIDVRGGQKRVVIKDQKDEELIKIIKIGNIQRNNNINRPKSENFDEKPEEGKSSEDYDDHTEDGIPKPEKDVDNSNESLYKEIQREARILRSPYKIALKYETSNLFVLILSEISDKIYFFRTFLLCKKYEIFSAKCSLYLLGHILLFTVVTFFYDIENIRKIFNNDNFPGYDFYLLYGFISNVIVWFIYKMLKCLLSNFKRMNQLIRLQNDYDRTNNEELINEIERKKEKFITTTKIKLAIYFSIMFILVIFCFLYLVLFCAVYTGTRKVVFKSYGIAVLEIVLIKLVYALILVILRSSSLSTHLRCLYIFVRFLETYLS